MPNTLSKTWLVQSYTSCLIARRKIFSNIDRHLKERGIVRSRKQKEEEKNVHIALVRNNILNDVRGAKKIRQGIENSCELSNLLLLQTIHNKFALNL